LFQLLLLIGLAYYRQRYVVRDMAANHATPIPAPAKVG